MGNATTALEDHDAIRVLPASALLANFKPIETIVDGLPIPRGGLTCITANTGHGKTTAATLLAVALCRGTPFAGREVSRGSVLVLAGENPDDYLGHLVATLQECGLTADDVSREGGHLLIVPGTFDIAYQLNRLKLNCSGAKFVAVIVDTSAAYLLADEENDNVQMRRHAEMLRCLAELPGNPAVVVLCHPTKRAAQDALLPRGGGSFLNEADANLTMWKDDAGILTMHWQGKIRGPSFEPVRFELVPVELTGYRDSRDKPVWSSIVRYIADARAEQIERRELGEEDRILAVLRSHRAPSVTDIGHFAGIVNGAGEVKKSTVDRKLRRLMEAGLVDQGRGGAWRLTGKGEKEAAGLSV